MTINRSWGYVPEDQEYKSSAEITRTLCEVAWKGGNLLLNVSPMSDGGLPSEQMQRLRAVGEWINRNGEAIYDTQAGLEPWQFYGPSTRRAERIFLMCPWRPNDHIVVRGLPVRRVGVATELVSGTALETSPRVTAEQELMGRDPVGDLVINIPSELVDPIATVISLEMTA